MLQPPIRSRHIPSAVAGIKIESASIAIDRRHAKRYEFAVDESVEIKVPGRWQRLALSGKFRWRAAA